MAMALLLPSRPSGRETSATLLSGGTLMRVGPSPSTMGTSISKFALLKLSIKKQEKNMTAANFTVIKQQQKKQPGSPSAPGGRLLVSTTTSTGLVRKCCAMNCERTTSKPSTTIKEHNHGANLDSTPSLSLRGSTWTPTAVSSPVPRAQCSHSRNKCDQLGFCVQAADSALCHSSSAKSSDHTAATARSTSSTRTQIKAMMPFGIGASFVLSARMQPWPACRTSSLWPT
mmetsp:Transcript_83898/g.195182  ORF Transcript_83898/g.195182 Transcript_83898/m.195182 type:complete len:229 (+) Transcript_83898:82-768(+)